MKKPLSQSQQQLEQIRSIFQVMKGSAFGQYLRLPTPNKKNTKTLEQAHFELSKRTEVLSHRFFMELIKGLAPSKPFHNDAEFFLLPKILTTEKQGGIATLEGAAHKCLPLTQKQLKAMKAHRAAFLKKLAFTGSTSEVLNFYNQPVINVLTASRVWHTGVDTLLAQPQKKLFKPSKPFQPDLALFRAEGKKVASHIQIYAQSIEENENVSLIYAYPYHFSDVGFYLRQHHKRNVRLAELAPNLKFVILDASSYAIHQTGVQHFLQGHQAQVRTHLYRADGVFGKSVAPNNPTVVELALDAGVFYEFIPTVHFHPLKGEIKPDHQRLSVERIEQGQNYVLVVNSVAGVIGLNTKTIVKVVQKDPLQVEIIGQMAALDHLRQKLTAEETQALVTHLNQTIYKPYRFYVRHFMVADHHEQQQLIWAMELSCTPKSVSAQVLRGIANSLHSTLIKENTHYRHAFDRSNIFPPIFAFIPPGTFMKANISGENPLDFTSDGRKVRKIIKLAGDGVVKLRAARIGAGA